MASSRPPPRPIWARSLKIIRRIHMYTGLFLLPWLLFFGASGVLFNHPNVGEDVRGQRVGPDEMAQLTGLTPWRPQAVAEAVVAEMNRADAGAYTLDPGFASRFNGVAVLKARDAEGQHMLLLDLERSAGILAFRRARPSGAKAPFSGAAPDLPQYSLTDVEARLAGLLEKKGLKVPGPLRGQAELAPELEFRVRDREGVSWNVAYDIATGSVAGRRSDQWPSIGVSQLFAKLHTTHHFPMKLGARWLWALFEDLLGLAMVVWAISGLFMWWQMKPTRIAGVASIAAAIGLAGAVMVGTASEILFGDVPQALGPGE
ncbi:hypothetical protein WME79_48995 [Sorangium sp. So ce726]|uniref:PepSY domain-containing protein n=1 Tax=Sorangium sp. So ce726 TaxID=3133319 RepID=UPI003F60587D